MQFVTFTEAHLDAAAALLTARHKAHQAAEPALPARFESAAEARKAVEGAWLKPETSGVAVFAQDRLIGYMFGTRQTDVFRGPHAWVHQPGSAIADGVSPELYRDMYAHLADGWVREGLFAHYAMVPAFDRAALDMWFALGFGQEQVMAIRDLADLAAPAPLPAGISIRRAGPDDLEGVLEVSDLIARHQMKTPVFAYRPLEGMADDYREGYSEVLADPNCWEWIAEEQGKVLGHALFQPAEPNLITPEACCYLAVAATRETDRGRGVGRALTEWGLCQAAQQGFRYCVTDWRATNLLSSRFWPRQGFRPTVYRLHRLVYSRIGEVLKQA